LISISLSVCMHHRDLQSRQKSQKVRILEICCRRTCSKVISTH